MKSHPTLLCCAVSAPASGDLAIREQPLQRLCAPTLLLRRAAVGRIPAILQFACASSGDVNFDSDCVLRISDLCTRFMDHFHDITERQFNTDYSVSGSKIIDFLDCIMDDERFTGACERTVSVNKAECNIKAVYRCVHLCPSRYTDRGKVPYLQCHLRAYTEN
jgi:hypothetical protein